MRTQDAVVQKIKESKSLLGFDREVLVPYLDFEHAKEFLKEGTTPDQWETTPLDEKTVLEEMREYMARIGWEKVEDHRGISAGRTIEKMQAWMWLLNTPQADELIEFADDGANYPQYGAPILAKICSVYGFPVPDSPSIKRMIDGLSCSPGCSEGCGEG